MRRSAARTGLHARHLSAAGLITVMLGGCGSASIQDLPAAAGPDRAPVPSKQPAGSVMVSNPEQTESVGMPRRSADLRDGRLRLVLEPRARMLRLVDTIGGAVVDRIPVGIGPTQVACTPQGPCFVTDTTGDALLVIRVAPDGRSMRLSRRVFVAGAPYAIAVDPRRKRLWVTLTPRNELVELGAHGRPHILRRYPTVQQPDGVRVDAPSGDVAVIGTAPPRTQTLADPASPDRP